jgi:hypothetical protein
MTTSADAYNQLQDFNSKRVNPDQAISDAESKYGVPGLSSQLGALRTLTSNLETSIGNVDPSVTGRTQGSLVTEAQRQRIVNNERQPLAEQYNQTTRNYADIGDQYNRASSLAQNTANARLSDQENSYQHLFGQYQSLVQQEQAAAQLAEARRGSAASANSGLNLAGLFGGNAGAPKQVGVNDHLQADITRLITPDYATRFNSGYTERQIQRLQQAYPELAGQIPNLVYAYRKQLTGT